MVIKIIMVNLVTTVSRCRNKWTISKETPQIIRNKNRPAPSITQICCVDSSILTNWTSPFHIVWVSGVLTYFISHWNSYIYRQIVKARSETDKFNLGINSMFPNCFAEHLVWTRKHIECISDINWICASSPDKGMCIQYIA